MSSSPTKTRVVKSHLVPTTHMLHATTEEAVAAISEVLFEFAKPVHFFEVCEAIMINGEPADVDGWSVIAIGYKARASDASLYVSFPPTYIKSAPPHDPRARHRHSVITYAAMRRDSPHDVTPFAMRGFAYPGTSYNKVLLLSEEKPNEQPAFTDLLFPKSFQAVPATLVVPVSAILREEDATCEHVAGVNGA